MDKKEKFKSNVAVIVAFVTVLGAIAACLSSVAVSDAGDADFAGLGASISAQKADIINNINAYEHYRAYTTYARYDQLGYLLHDPEASDSVAVANGAFQREVWGVASGLRSVFFNPRYIEADGSYDIVRELQEAYAEDAQSEDLDPQPYFDESDHLRSRSSFLAADMIVFAFSFWFLTLAQVTEKQIKYVWAAIGVMLMLAGIVGIIIGRFVI